MKVDEREGLKGQTGSDGLGGPVFEAPASVLLSCVCVWVFWGFF